MSQTAILVQTLKAQLKQHGLTYAAVGMQLGLSEASIKRQFSQQSFSLKTLDAICGLMNMELSELVHASEAQAPRLRQLSAAQEAELVKDPRRMLVAVCVLNHWSLQQIVSTYAISEAEGVLHLLQLDRLGLIRLQAENRVRLMVARDFTWLPDGPIHRFFNAQAQGDFLGSRFEGTGEILRFQHGMLGAAANARFQRKLERLVQEFAELHAESQSLLEDQRFGTSLLLAMRPWEPAVFEALRRQPDTRKLPAARKVDRR